MRGDIVLVAGNPTAYPVEYYDPNTESFQGVIPQLLREFGACTGCEILYCEGGEEDRRASLAENLQVDVISGCLIDEVFRGPENGRLVILETRQNGGPEAYALQFTTAAPDWLREELSRFLAETSAAAKAGLLVESAQVQPAIYHRKLENALLGLLAGMFALGVAAAVLAGKLHRQRQKLRQSQERDSLTGIGSPEALNRRLQRIGGNKGRVLYVLFYFHLDLSDLRYEEVDGLLRRAAAVLKDCAADTDLLARTAESDFAALRLSPGESETELWVSSTQNRIQEAVCAQVLAGVYRLGASDGELDEILACAAYTAQVAHRAGKPFGVCTDSALRAFLEERRLCGQLEHGFTHGEFKLYVQLYVDTKTGRYAGGKALSRWEHPDKGLLLPGQFLPCMEREGTVCRLDLYTIEQSCAFLEDLNQAGQGPFFLCCSLSKETVKEEHFAEQCGELLARYTFPRDMLVLEFPEDMAPPSPGMADESAAALRKLGVRLAAGDFGKDVSVFLTGWRPDILTLGKPLVDAVESGAGDTVLRGMIRLGHELGCQVFAVGAEREEQFRALREMNCDMVQGFCLHTPVPARQVYIDSHPQLP